MSYLELLDKIHRSNERLSGLHRYVHERKLDGKGSDGVGEIDIALDDFLSVTLRDFRRTFHSLFLSYELRVICLHFMLDGGRTGIIVDFHADGSVQLEMGVDNAIPYGLLDARAIIESSLVPISGSIEDFGIFHELEGPSWNIRIHLNDFDVSIAELDTCQVRLVQRLGVSRAQAVDRYGDVLRRLRDGTHESLVGEPETSWLEFKSSVDLQTEKGRVEFAQDVARFANSEKAGLLIVGFRTERRDGVDVATKMTPVVRSENYPRRYEDVVDGRVYPPIRGLHIEQVQVTDKHCLIAILIPAQREDDKPFLVHGAVVEGKVEGVFFSVVRRRGEGSIPVTAREVHALISSGRRALRRGD